VVVFLTDGRANVTKAGEGDRAQAEADALASARVLRAEGVNALLVDTSPRPQAAARTMAEAMGARYLPLPHADSRTLTGAVRAASLAG
jgi:magnesium chelatase subunit D